MPRVSESAKTEILAYAAKHGVAAAAEAYEVKAPTVYRWRAAAAEADLPSDEFFDDSPKKATKKATKKAPVVDDSSDEATRLRKENLLLRSALAEKLIGEMLKK